MVSSDDKGCRRMIDKRNNASEHADRSDGGSSEGIDSTLRDFTSLPSPGPPIADTRPEAFDEGLLVCGACHSRLMYPADCEEHGREHWYIELKCPDCSVRTWTRFDVEMLDALDRELDRAQDEIEADLACLTRANMADYITRFVSALDAGAIEPEDFTA
jgi:hypothetical protein